MIKKIFEFSFLRRIAFSTNLHEKSKRLFLYMLGTLQSIFQNFFRIFHRFVFILFFFGKKYKEFNTCCTKPKPRLEFFW